MKHFCGFSLLEILIATFILAFGLLGMVGLHIHSFKSVKNSYWSTLATAQLITMAESRYISGGYCSDLNRECQRLLPRGQCECETERIRVCWRSERARQCLTL